MDYLQYNGEYFKAVSAMELMKVLNLVINGLPSIPGVPLGMICAEFYVLNLVINGLPSILYLLFI